MSDYLPFDHTAPLPDLANLPSIDTTFDNTDWGFANPFDDSEGFVDQLEEAAQALERETQEAISPLDVSVPEAGYRHDGRPTTGGKGPYAMQKLLEMTVEDDEELGDSGIGLASDQDATDETDDEFEPANEQMGPKTWGGKDPVLVQALAAKYTYRSNNDEDEDDDDEDDEDGNDGDDEDDGHDDDEDDEADEDDDDEDDEDDEDNEDEDEYDEDEEEEEEEEPVRRGPRMGMKGLPKAPPAAGSNDQSKMVEDEVIEDEIVQGDVIGGKPVEDETAKNNAFLIELIRTIISSKTAADMKVKQIMAVLPNDEVTPSVSHEGSGAAAPAKVNQSVGTAPPKKAPGTAKKPAARRKPAVQKTDGGPARKGGWSDAERAWFHYEMRKVVEQEGITSERRFLVVSDRAKQVGYEREHGAVKNQFARVLRAEFGWDDRQKPKNGKKRAIVTSARANKVVEAEKKLTGEQTQQDTSQSTSAAAGTTTTAARPIKSLKRGIEDGDFDEPASASTPPKRQRRQGVPRGDGPSLDPSANVTYMRDAGEGNTYVPSSMLYPGR